MPSSELPGREPASDARVVASVTRHFPAVTASVAHARRFLLGTLPARCLLGADAVVLMLSELATNAVVHASTPFDVTLAVASDGTSVRVAVKDGAGGYPAPQDPDVDAPHGRGLHIVRTLADAWGIEMRHGQPGKTVWFERVVGRAGSPADRGGGRTERARSAVVDRSKRHRGRGRRERRGSPWDCSVSCDRVGYREGQHCVGGNDVGGNDVGGNDVGGNDVGGNDVAHAKRPRGPRRAARRRRGHRRERGDPLRQRGGGRAHGLAARVPGRPLGSRPGARVADRGVPRRLRPFRPLAGRRAGRAQALHGHPVRRRVRGRHRTRAQHLRASSRRHRRRRHLPATRRPKAPALVGADQRAARDPRQGTDRRRAG